MYVLLRTFQAVVVKLKLNETFMKGEELTFNYKHIHWRLMKIGLNCKLETYVNEISFPDEWEKSLMLKIKLFELRCKCKCSMFSLTSNYSKQA